MQNIRIKQNIRIIQGSCKFYQISDWYDGDQGKYVVCQVHVPVSQNHM